MQHDVIIGGMGAITAALRGACEDLGVEIRTGAAVQQINVANGVASGVTLVTGEQIDAYLVVSNADPKRTFQTLVEPRELDADFLRDRP